MKRWHFYILLWQSIFITALANGQSSNSDSISLNLQLPGHKIKADGFIATSFSANNNWNSHDNSFVLLSGCLNLTFIKNKGKFNRLLEFRSEINYQKFIDSVWIKNSDNLFISSIWVINETKKLKSSFHVSIKTQLTNSWDQSSPNSVKQTWKSGPMLPFAFIAGYGLNKKFRNNSYLNISVITVKIESRPRTILSSKDIKTLAVTDKIIFDSEYGINIQSCLSKNILKKLLWENRITSFANGIEASNVKFDLQNTLAIKPLPYMKIRLAQNLIYDYTLSKKIQSRHELLVGFSIEK